MANKEGKNSCTCNDQLQTKTLNCLNCKNDWTRALQYHERVSKCLEHKHTIAICSPGYSLCPTCTEKGYYIEGKSYSMGMMMGYEIKKKND